MSRPKHAPRMPFAVLVLGLIGGTLVALLALNTASAANEVRRHDLAVKDATVADSLVQLNNDVNASAAPQDLAAAAAALGMVPANNPAFLVIGADGRVQLMGSPGAVTPPAVPVVRPISTPTPTATSTAASTPTSTPTAASPGKAQPSSLSSSSKAPSSSKSTPSSTPTPSPTPTPNTTLPGGPR